MATTKLALRRLSLVFLTFFLLSFVSSGDYKVTECFPGDGSDVLGEATLTCPPGDVITIDEALLGRNKWGVCVITGDDCVEKTKIFKSCEGLNNCSKTFKTYSHSCGYSTMLLLTYSCTPSFPTPVPTPTTDAPPDNSDVNPTPQPTGEKDEPDGKEGAETEDGFQEIGLIIVCVVASLVTVIMLLIAIIMVIRRLLQYYRRDKEERSINSSSVIDCIDSMCIKVDKLPCFSSPPDATESLNLNARKRSVSSLKTNGETNATTCAQNRMAPVGQESSDTDMSRNSELMVTNDTGGSSSSLESQNPCEQTAISDRRSDNKLADLNPIQDGISSDQVSFTMGYNNNVSQMKNCADKISSWRQKEMNGGPTSDNKNNNYKAMEDCESKPSVSTDMPKFDAVAIPNTELGSLC